MSRVKEAGREIPEVIVRTFLSDHTDEQLKDITIEELRRIIPKLFLFLENHNCRILKRVKGLWEKPPGWWDSSIPFLDPNNCKKTQNDGEDSLLKKPTKRELMSMLFYLVKKCRLKECRRQVENSPGSVSMDTDDLAAMSSIASPKPCIEQLLDDIQSDVAALSLSQTPEKNLYINAADSMRKRGSCINAMNEDDLIRLIEDACSVKAAICIHRTIGDVPASYKKLLSSLSGAASSCSEENSSSGLSHWRIASGSSNAVTGSQSSCAATTSLHVSEYMGSAFEVTCDKQNSLQLFPSTCLDSIKVEPDANLCFDDVCDVNCYMHSSSPETSISSCSRIGGTATSTPISSSAVSCFIQNPTSHLPLLNFEDIMEVLSPLPGNNMDSDCYNVEVEFDVVTDLE